MIPIEVRKKIIEARKKGLKIKELVRAYGYGEATIGRLLKKERETGDIMPETGKCGRKSEVDKAMLEKMKAVIESRSDITLAEIKEELEHGISLSAISKQVRNKLGFKVKKRVYMQARETELM